MINLPRGLFDFQEDCVTALLDSLANPIQKKSIIVKSPTGSGKTIMMIDLIDKYLDYRPNTCFAWFCPGKGDLEEQSKEKMDRFLPNRETADIMDVLLQGFEEKQTVFINWERVTKKGNKAITEGEKKNLFERIQDAKRDGINFIVIIDEEHLNNTSKAKDVLDAFDAPHTIRLSATAKKNPHAEWYEIPEEKVINSGLITRAMYINEDIDTELIYDMNTEYQVLIDLAEDKREAIHSAYLERNKQINPLVIIQFPSNSERLIEYVESTLEELGVNYDNGLLAKWMSEEKININDIENNQARPQYLLMKQAISTGWDCPRAKILIKLRSNMNEDFELQTLGRLRRMPEAVHYDDILLDYCFLYTFDEKYKNAALKESNTYEVRRLFLKSKAKSFQLVKEMRDHDLDIVGEKETLVAIYNFLVDKYALTTNVSENQKKLETYGFKFGTTLKNRFIQGEFTTMGQIQEPDNKYQVARFEVDTHRNGIDLLHCIDIIKKITGLQSTKAKAVLRHLFFKKPQSTYKLLKLGLREWYAFIINNILLLQKDFRDVTATFNKNTPMPITKKVIFTIPEEELYRISSDETNPIQMLSNVYEKYDSSMIIQEFRSKSERLFERYCESNDQVEWVYKNGDKGQQYLSIVYLTGIGKQYLFYPDYIIKLKDNRTFIVETKGGESMFGGQVVDKNIDIQIENKFMAFKEYAKVHEVNWAFVRDKNDYLYFNNKNYSSNMTDAVWKTIDNLF